MTDSSSEDHAMINELLQAKMETAQSQTQIVRHLDRLKMGMTLGGNSTGEY